MALRLFSFAKREKMGSSGGPLMCALLGTYAAVGLLLIMIIILYTTLLMSPQLLQRLMKDVMQCDDFPDYLSRNSTTVEIVGNSPEHYYTDSKTLPPPAAASDHPPSKHNASSVTNSPEKGSLETNPPAKLSVLVGILTTAGGSDRRHQLRLAYTVQASDVAVFTVRFVLGALEKEEHRVWVGMENATFGDIIVLACKENMNEGKTFSYFTTLVAMGVQYDYVMKTDDDSYVRLSNLARQLNWMPRTDLYYGYSLPCDTDVPLTPFLAGAGYILSWDLVLWINESPIPRNRSIGVEDILVGDWFRDGGVANNRPSTRGLFYDYIDAGGPCAHELTNDTVLVHKLKSSERWQHVLAYFERDRLSNPLKN